MDFVVGFQSKERRQFKLVYFENGKIRTLHPLQSAVIGQQKSRYQLRLKVRKPQTLFWTQYVTVEGWVYFGSHMGLCFVPIFAICLVLCVILCFAHGYDPRAHHPLNCLRRGFKVSNVFCSTKWRKDDKVIVDDSVTNTSASQQRGLGFNDEPLN